MMAPSLSRVLALALSVMTFACEERGKPSSPPAAKPVSEKTAPSSTPSVASASVATPEEVKQRISEWVGAQNSGDFQKYEKLYSARFTGVKRVGDRAFDQDRATWMTDRKKMFEKPFVVTATNIVVGSLPGVMMATFEQTWKSDTFQDRGRKQILFVKEGKELRISREEMLSSALKQKGDVPDIQFHEAALATRTIDSMALLLPDVPKLAWATEHPRYISDQLAQRAVSTKALPKNLQALLDDSYEVFDSAGNRCEVKARGFQLLARVIPHFGTVQQWEDTFAEQEGRAKVTVPVESRALDLWHMATAMMSDEAAPGLFLALEMEPSKCRDAAWGRKVRADGPSPWKLRKATDEEMALVLAAVPAHAVVRGFEAEARGESPNLPDVKWQEKVDQAEVQVVSDGGDKEFIYALVRGTGGCASETPSSVGLVFRRYEGRISPLQHPVYIEGPILGAVDLNADGEPEFVTGTTLVEHTLEGFWHVINHSPISFDCGC